MASGKLRRCLRLRLSDLSILRYRSVRRIKGKSICFEFKRMSPLANTPARGYLSCEHHRWQKRPPSIQAKAGNTLTTFCLFYYQAVSKNDVLNLFFDTPRSLFAHNLSKVYGGATLVQEISPEIRMRCRKFNFRPCFLPRNANQGHKAVPASLQASLAGTALNRWQSYLPSMVPAYQLACGLRIRRTRYHSFGSTR